MTPERWKQVKQMLDAALERRAEDRAAFVSDACTGDAELRAEVDSLIASDDQASRFLDTAAVPGVLRSFAEGQPETLGGARIGPYRILSEIAHGGMGAVYLAERDDREYRKQVAIKLIKSDLGTTSAVRRFRQERQILADLDHPNIARLLDGGTTDDGMPYFVMEFVEGVPIDAYCDARNLAVRQRIELFGIVCSAVGQAHRQGVVHLDLKPANILVTAVGTPKLLDFGIAALLSPELEAPSTATAPRRMTPEYASPEQLRAGPLTAASDIYTLGVLLYRLLTGRGPYQVDPDLPHEFARAICEEEPTPPSAHVAPHPRQRLTGDLDAIVLKALRKEPERRYRTVEELSEDIRCHLQGLPVTARKDRLIYRAKRFVQRSSRTLVTGLSMAAVAALVSALVVQSRSRPVRPPWVQLTDFADSATSPALSPDGRSLVFIRGPDTFVGPGEIYLKRLPDGEPTQLTRDGSSKMSPTFSPDGTRILYTVTPAWDTWSVPVGGGQPQRVLPNASGLSWIDARHMLFSEIKAGIHMAIVTATPDRADARDVYVPADTNFGMAHRSALSPDGRWVLVVEMGPAGDWLPCRLVPFDGTSRGRQVGPAGAGCTSAAWSPDGRLMYFSSNSGGLFHIWRQMFSAPQSEQITFGPTEEEGLAVAADGRSLITSVGTTRSTVWLHDEHGERQVSVEGEASGPRLARDGGTLYYLVHHGPAGEQPPHGGELWMADRRSGKAERLLPGLQVTGYDVSVDGKQLVVAVREADGSSRLWLAPLDHGVTPRRLASPPDVDRPVYGLRDVVFFEAHENGRHFIYRMNIDGTARRKVVADPIIEFAGVSPDGEWILAYAAVSDQETRRSVLAYPTRGGPPTRLCYNLCSVRWSPDARFLYLSPGENPGNAVRSTYMIPLSPGRALPPVPALGVRTEAELFALHGVKTADGGVFPGPIRDVYAVSRLIAHRNLYRIPIP